MIKKIVKEYFSTIVLTVVLIVLNIFVISPVKVSGTSMSPTLADNQIMYQLKMVEVKRFDIVTFKTPQKKTFIKRVIGLPGDEVTYVDGKLTVNNQSYDEDYTLEPFHGNYAFTVPSDHYFLLGDNRNDSTDSRELGFINKSKIIGVAHPIFK